jgi:hypothetical protein
LWFGDGNQLGRKPRLSTPRIPQPAPETRQPLAPSKRRFNAPPVNSISSIAASTACCILTTNRPDQIEPALVSRPGRIDLAIEFPLPDEESRAKLTKLYARGLEVSDEIMELIVARTKGVSAAFIKELMRRCTGKSTLVLGSSERTTRKPDGMHASRILSVLRPLGSHIQTQPTK